MKPKFEIAGITFYPYSLLMIAGAVVCFLLFMLVSFVRHKNVFGENLFAMQMLVVSLGAALPAAMVADSLFKMTETGVFELGGATFYGGMLFAVALYPLFLSFKINRKVTVYDRLCDLAPCIPAGHCLGRIGCFLGGCCFGSPTDSALGVIFSEGTLPFEYYGGEVAIHPTQLYEAAYLLVLSVFLFVFAKKHAFPLYFILYGAGRIFIEFFRSDNRGGIGLPLSPAQFISVILIITGSIVFTVKTRKSSNKP